MSERKLTVVVVRCDGLGMASRREKFEVSRSFAMTVADVLFAINDDPRLASGDPTRPITWSSACTWPACGVCTISINGRAAPACGTRVDEVVPKRGKLVLAPLDAFPVRRDLSVDRSRMMRDAARAEAYLDEDPRAVEASVQAFSACTRCGACVDACPEASASSVFMGPYALGAMHATKIGRGAALPLSVLEAGGIADCGHVQNCVETCPEQVPLGRAMRAATRAGVKQWWSGLFKLGKR